MSEYYAHPFELVKSFCNFCAFRDYSDDVAYALITVRRKRRMAKKPEKIESTEWDWVLPEEAAVLLGVTKFTLQNWRAKRRGPRYFSRGETKHPRVMYKRSDIAEFMARSMVPHDPAPEESLENASGSR